ncbi:type I-C CRISPR-associated protein Cas7/Csd2 [Basfia succiniciproducens]|uniref:CRISPR-associated protein Csd2 n=1 Tax=Basfia succiniciproducens TaxID=653940 RepID=A0A1G5BK25_9PAST|nr:type I-C CRISPR-associated protein Cas7/Csd2 [Basfia succiniciproducens]SCX90505.1 CRISPR-associated protein Csd2 [Basfia succiniciproducens]
MSIQNRYEFVYFFDVTNGNPNGDPDAGNMPRLDPESSKGLVTDVCLKRKIRNFVDMTSSGQAGYEIFVRENSVLNLQIERAYTESEEVIENLKAWKEYEKNKKKKNKNNSEEGISKPKRHYEDIAQDWMCENFFDVRTFGAVMSTGKEKEETDSDGEKSKIAKRAGQVRGPVQLAFAQSIDPIVPLELSITRVAVTSEAEKEEGKDTMMGRKYIVPYALYRVHGFISANLAAKTGFSEEDLQKLWQALQLMFEHDRSAARGEMAARKLIVFKHDSALGSVPAHKLFDSVKVERINGESGTPATGFADYQISIEKDKFNGITVEELL